MIPRVPGVFTARVLALVALVVLGACGAPPPMVPRPLDDARPVPRPPVEPATVAIPITLAIGTLRSQLAALAPASDSLDRAQCSSLGGIVCHQYVYRRDTLDLAMAGNRIELLARLRYRARMALPAVGGVGSCGYGDDPMKRAELRMSAALGWRDDWSIGTRATTLSATLTDRCIATVFRIDATPLMQRMLDGQLEELTATVDSLVPAASSLRTTADSLWRTMHEPIQLDTGVWLVMAPDGIVAAPFSASGGVLNTGLILTARPRIVLGERPAPALRPLPRLTTAPAQSRIRVPLEVELPFEDLSRRVTAELREETARLDTRVREARIWGVRDTVAVQLDVTGKLTGTVYLVGRMRYDPERRLLTLEDLDFTVQSTTRMSGIRAALGSHFIRRTIERALMGGRWNIGEQMDVVRDALGAELNRELAPGVALAGRMDRVELTAFWASSSSFMLHIALDGQGRLDVR